jgi:hypothetical protein
MFTLMQFVSWLLLLFYSVRQCASLILVIAGSKKCQSMNSFVVQRILCTSGHRCNKCVHEGLLSCCCCCCGF